MKIISEIKDGYAWVEIRPGKQKYIQLEPTPGTVDPRKRGCSAFSRTLRGQALAVHPDQAAEFSEKAAKAGTGAYYDEQGRLCADSEGALQREFANRGFYDKNAGFRDQSRKGYEEAEARAIEFDPYNVSPIWQYRR